MAEYTTVQEGRHAVRDLLSKAHKAGDGSAESKAVDVLTREARGLLKGRVGLSQQEQVDNLNRVGSLIAAGITLSTVEAVKEALQEAADALTEAKDANASVTNLAATRDFEAWQEEKRAKREAEQAAYDSSYDEEDSDEDYDDEEDGDDEE